MYRRFIATIAATSIALTAVGAVPAAADNDDLAKALAAILGIAVIGKIIHDRNDRDDHVTRAQPVKRHKYDRPHVRDSLRHGTDAHKGPRSEPPRRRHVEPRPIPRHAKRKPLPSRCLRYFETRKGSVRMFPTRCLQRSYAATHRLPNFCKTDVRTRNGKRFGYEAHCLRREGYRVARH